VVPPRPIVVLALVAAELLASPNPAETDHPPQVEAAWAPEVERRACRVMAGESAGFPWWTSGNAARLIFTIGGD